MDNRNYYRNNNNIFLYTISDKENKMTHISVRKDYYIDWETGIIHMKEAKAFTASWNYHTGLRADNIIIK